MKSLKSLTPKLTTKGDANSYTLSVGQGMKVLMNKPLGYQQMTSGWQLVIMDKKVLLIS